MQNDAPDRRSGPRRTDGRKRDRLTRRQLAALLVPPDADGWPLVDEEAPLAPIAYSLTEKGLNEPTGLGIALLRARQGTQRRWYPVRGERGVLMLPRATLAALVAEGGRP